MATNPRVDPATDLIVPEPPRLPAAPAVWEAQYQDQYSNVLRLYFNRLNNLLQEINVSTGSGGIYPLGTAGDAFGRLRTSNPFTLFDSKNRFRQQAGCSFKKPETHERACFLLFHNHGYPVCLFFLKRVRAGL